MPAAITADWEAVRHTAEARNSILEAAQAHQVSYDAAKQRAKREGWVLGRRTNKLIAAAKEAHAKAIAIRNPSTVTNVTSTSDALVSLLADDNRETRISLSKGVRRAAKHVENMPEAQIFAGADRVKHLVGAASTLHGWEEKKQSQEGLVSIALIRLELPATQQEARSALPVIDVEVE